MSDVREPFIFSRKEVKSLGAFLKQMGDLIEFIEDTNYIYDLEDIVIGDLIQATGRLRVLASLFILEDNELDDKEDMNDN